MFEPGWYHTGLISYDEPKIEYFANGPGYEDRAFDHGPFESFSKAKDDLKFLIVEQIGILKQMREEVQKVRKEIKFTDLL